MVTQGPRMLLYLGPSGEMYKVNTEGEYKNKELFILFSIVLWAGSESVSYYFCLCSIDLNQ